MEEHAKRPTIALALVELLVPIAELRNVEVSFVTTEEHAQALIPAIVVELLMEVQLAKLQSATLCA
jgi:hypothetical protein